jgi:hypothetical protein
MATLSAPTLQNLITTVRTILRQPDSQNSNWKDEELKIYINEGIRLYFVEVAQSNEGLFATNTTLNLVANTESVALPVDCFEVRALYKRMPSGYVALSYNNAGNLDYSTQSGGNASSYTPYYSFEGNNLILRPIPDFSETAGLKLDYIRFPETLVNGGDSLTSQISPIFKQVVEMYAVYKAKLSESMVSGVVMHKIPEENLNALYNVFKQAIERRSKNPTYVQPFNP